MSLESFGEAKSAGFQTGVARGDLAQAGRDGMLHRLCGEEAIMVEEKYASLLLFCLCPKP